MERGATLLEMHQWPRLVGTSEAACVIDDTGAVVEANPAWQTLAGVSTGTHHHRSELFDADTCPICPMLGDAAAGSTIRSAERIVQADDVRRIRVSGMPLDDRHMLVILQDRTFDWQRQQWTANALYHLTQVVQRDGGGPRHNTHNTGFGSRLTNRERDVLECMATGMTARQMAAALLISHNTARNHIQNVLHKLNATNRAHAVAYAYAEGILGNEIHAREE